jgi:hypothetical protein
MEKEEEEEREGDREESRRTMKVDCERKETLRKKKRMRYKSK